MCFDFQITITTIIHGRGLGSTLSMEVMPYNYVIMNQTSETALHPVLKLGEQECKAS